MKVGKKSLVFEELFQTKYTVKRQFVKIRSYYEVCFIIHK